jgi:hypothetical protein
MENAVFKILDVDSRRTIYRKLEAPELAAVEQTCRAARAEMQSDAQAQWRDLSLRKYGTHATSMARRLVPPSHNKSIVRLLHGVMRSDIVPALNSARHHALTPGPGGQGAVSSKLAEADAIASRHGLNIDALKKDVIDASYAYQARRVAEIMDRTGLDRWHAARLEMDEYLWGYEAR